MLKYSSQKRRTPGSYKWDPARFWTAQICQFGIIYVPQKSSQLLVETTHVYQWYFSKELPRVLFKISVDKYLLLSCAPPQLGLQGDVYSRDFLLRADGCSVEGRIYNLLIFFEMFCTDEGPKDCSSL